MHVLCIGGTRFVGPYVVRGLEAAGHEVTIFHRGLTGPRENPGVPRLLGDRENLSAHRVTLRSAEPDVVLDLCATRGDHVDAAAEVFAGCAGRLVVVASVRADAAVAQRTVRRRRNLPGTSLRLAPLYGPGDPLRGLFPWVKRMSDRRRVIPLHDAEAVRRCTRAYVEDAARAIVLAVTHSNAAGRSYDVGEPDALTLAEWVEATGRAAGWHGRVVAVTAVPFPPHLLRRHAECDEVLDSSAVRRDLGYTEETLRPEGLRRAVVWEREQRPPAEDDDEFDYPAEDAIVRAHPGVAACS